MALHYPFQDGPRILLLPGVAHISPTSPMSCGGQPMVKSVLSFPESLVLIRRLQELEDLVCLGGKTRGPVSN